MGRRASRAALHRPASGRGLVRLFSAFVLAMVLTASLASAYIVDRVSLNDDGQEGNANSNWSAISEDGRYVAFVSYASNLVDGDSNALGDIFVYDRDTDTIERVTLGVGGAEPDDDSWLPAISGDGRYVAFASLATNLVAGDTNGQEDIFLYDRDTGIMERVSVSSAEAQGNDQSTMPAISADGQFVAFASVASNLVPSDTNETLDIFVRDLAAGATERVSVAGGGTQANNFSAYPSLSADGRYVAFSSYAFNLVAGDTNNFGDVFVYDRQEDTIEMASVAADGTQGDASSDYPSISADGQTVAYSGPASTLVAGDENEVSDVFVWDRVDSVVYTVTRVSVADDATEGDANSYTPSISGDGQYIAFTTVASTLIPWETRTAAKTSTSTAGSRPPSSG